MTNYIYLDGQKIKLSDETADELRNQRKEIEVPECIEFEAIGNNGLALKFDEDRSMYWENGLCVDEFESKELDLILVKCKREDLKVGDWAYRTDLKSPLFTNKEQYGLIVNDEEHRYGGTNRNIYVSSDVYKYWYKVVRRGK